MRASPKPPPATPAPPGASRSPTARATPSATAAPARTRQRPPDNPDWSADVPPGRTAQVYTTFHNVPWPGGAVAITWYTAGTTAYVYPFGSNSSPPPGASCQSWYVLGLHGINEGYKGEKHQKRSPELADFAQDLKKGGPIYGCAVEEDVPYPTIKANWRDAAGYFNAERAVVPAPAHPGS